MAKEFEPYIELHILTDNEKVIEVDLYYHENESQGFDNFIKTYKTLSGARKAAKKYELKIVEHEEQY